MARISDKLAAGRTLSFEFFPPKSASAQLTLGSTIAELAPLGPDFVSITYGAGGSDRRRTGDVVEWIRRETDVEPMAHLTCVGHTRTDVAGLLVEYRRMGVENILALGGDLPTDGSAPAGDYRYALDLLHDVASTGCFSVGVAAHPEVHPHSSSRESDRRHLADKLSIADFAITQFFFDIDHYRRLVGELAALGIDKPIVPGIMPITSVAQISRMAQMSGAEVPTWLTDRLATARDSAEVKKIGVEIASQLCVDLIEAGAPGLHLYTLNRSEVAKQIKVNLRTVLV
jgi:methylenetetrahydrofolate reductase (NADPH)